MMRYVRVEDRQTDSKADRQTVREREREGKGDREGWGQAGERE